MKKNMTYEERIHNALGVQKVEEYKARHAYLHGFTYSREEWDYFWLKSPNTTWAHQFGRMVGWDEVYLNSVEHTDRMATFRGIDNMMGIPEIQGHDLRSVTRSGAHALASDVIEVAEDGMSARSYYLTPGTLMGSVGFDGADGGPGGVWLWERYGSDFVYYDGKWQWFHEQVCPDIAGDYDDENWAYDLYQEYLSKDLNIGDLGGRPAQLTEPGLFHKDYSIVQEIQDTVPAPMPYKTLDDNNTYSPGRNDPSGKITIKIEHEVVADHKLDGHENPFKDKD